VEEVLMIHLVKREPLEVQEVVGEVLMEIAHPLAVEVEVLFLLDFLHQVVP
jgi:hypothetical protein